ncbi:MAG: glycosyltransferase family 39 protein [Verrucomicrobiota bacterium]
MRPLLLFLTILLAWAAIFLPGLGNTELKGEEGRRILPARRMMQTGDYVLPYSEGRPYHRKPPLVNWAIAGSFRLHGEESEWAARLPSALAVLLLALTAAWAGKVIVGPQGAWWLPLAVLTTIGTIEKGRLAEIEAIFLSLSGIGMLGWLAGWHRGGSLWARWLWAGVWFGLASLAKGPVFLPFFYAIALVILWRGRQLKELLHPAHWLGLGLALLLPLPWAMAAAARLKALPQSARDDQAQVWMNQITKRLDPGAIDWKSYPLGPFETLLLLCPWALVSIYLWRRARRVWWPEIAEKDRALLLGLGWGMLTMGLIYALLPESRARFQLPLVAPNALLAVLMLAHWQRHAKDETADSTAARWTGTAVRVLLLLITIAGVTLPWWLAPGSMMISMAWMLGLSPLIWLTAVRVARMTPPGKAFAEAGLLAAWGMIFFGAVITPVMRRHEDIRPTALRILEVTGPEPKIMALNPGPQPFLFYLGKNCVETAFASRVTPETTHLVVPAERWEGKDLRQRLARAGFAEKILEVKDDDATPYVLLKRGPKPP